MSSIRRNVLLGACLLGLSTAAIAAKPTVRTAENPLRIAVIADTATDASFTGTVQFRVTNTGRRAVKVPSWQLPVGGLDGDLFQVQLDGQDVDYTGRLVKRSRPTDADFLVVRGGETKVVTVNLADHYDLGETGRYSITFKSFLQDAKTDDGRVLASANGRMAQLQSAPLSLWVDGEAVREQQKMRDRLSAKKPPTGGGGTVVNGISYVGCSSTQINTLGTAINAARNYSENAKGYLVGGTVGPRYTTWFGAYTSSRYGTARSNFTAIDTAMDQSGGQIKINCGCNQSYFAYVYPTQPYQIWVCRAFWSAGTTGTDSKAGTLIHEMSHFNVVAGTDDIVYGQAGAKSLAISDPNGALNNADSHEYFAENTPSQQ